MIFLQNLYKFFPSSYLYWQLSGPILPWKLIIYAWYTKVHKDAHVLSLNSMRRRNREKAAERVIQGPPFNNYMS